MAGFIFAPNSVDLTAPSTNIGTTTPPAITASTIFRSANSGNAAFVALPFGTGAFQLQQTDSTATGGNARGSNAVDLQKTRAGAAQVASGSGACVINSNNTASGANSFAQGDGNTATGNTSVAMGLLTQSTITASFSTGYLSVANGIGSFVMGGSGNAKGTQYIFVLGSEGITSALGAGKAQLTASNISRESTSNTPVVLNSNGSGTGNTGNQLVLQNNSAIYVEGLLIATVTGAGDTSSWKIAATIKRGANAASTVLVGSTVTLVHQNAGAAAWAVALTADTTNGCLAVTVTGETARTIRWSCSLFASEVAF